MESRKALILEIIIIEYLKTGQPVCSAAVVKQYRQENISPATVRNEMLELDNEGYISQPHTSAGRIPTEKAYLYHLENLAQKKIRPAAAKSIDEALGEKSEENFKQAAKIIAQISGQAVFWAFHRRNLYYTGLSNLFSQPEFADLKLVYDISDVIDRLDEIIDNLFHDLPDAVQVLVGSHNPFGDFCGAVLGKYLFRGQTGLIGIIGPMRMDYEKNLGIVKYVQEILG